MSFIYHILLIIQIIIQLISIDMFELFTRRDLGVSGRVFIADRESGKIRQVGVYTMFHSLRKLICSTNRLFGV